MNGTGLEHEDAGGTCAPSVVGTLAVLQSAIQAMPDPRSVASLVEAGLGGLPGVARARVTAFEEPIEQEEARGAGGGERLWLETLRGRYGFIELELDDRGAFAPYEPWVRNLGNAVALHLETEAQRRRLEGLVDRLNRANARLREASARHARNARREGFLARCGELLAASVPDAEAVMAGLRSLLAEYFGGPCVLHRRGLDGEWGPPAIGARDRAEAEAVEALLGRVLPGPAETLASSVRSGEPVLVGHLPAERLSALLQPDAAGVVARLGVRSYLMVPARIRTEPVGLICLLGVRREFDQYDLETAKKIATRLAFALENARLFERARDAAADREQLLAIVSHDLRNPLTAIKLQLEVLVRRLRGGECGEALVTRSAPMGAAIEQMQGLLEDLLDFSRLGAGRLALEKRPVDLAVLGREAVEVIRPLAEGKDVAVAAVFDGPVEANCDPDRIRQVLANLLGNAIKFTPPGGRVDVSVTRTGKRVCLTVRDTGPGIAPELLPRVFDRFWQARRGDRAGLGLGLAIVKSIAEAHGGTVRAESEPGTGTTMHVTLPAE